MPGALDGDAQGPLVLGADPGAAARLDFGPVGNEPPYLLDVLVVYELDMLDAEGADPASRHKPPAGTSTGAPARSAATRPSGASARPSGWAAPRSSGWTALLRAVRRPVGGGCFGSHTFRFLWLSPASERLGQGVIFEILAVLEGQIVGFVPRRFISRSASLTITTSATSLTSAIAATVVFVVAAAA